MWLNVYRAVMGGIVLWLTWPADEEQPPLDSYLNAAWQYYGQFYMEYSSDGHLLLGHGAGGDKDSKKDVFAGQRDVDKKAKQERLKKATPQLAPGDVINVKRPDGKMEELTIGRASVVWTD